MNRRTKNGARSRSLLLAAALLAGPAQAAGLRPRAARLAAPQRAAATQARYVKQEEVVTFPNAGAVRVRAVEIPGVVPRLEFVSARTGRRLLLVPVGRSSPGSYIREPGNSLINPFVRFMVMRETGIAQPLVFAVAVRPGGSDHGFETTLVGEAGGVLKSLALRPQPSNSIQGGVFVGDLGGGRGPGLAVWSFLWGDEAHYARHRYEVTLHSFDARRAAFGRGRRLETKGVHGSGEDALAELGLPRYKNLLDHFPAIADYRN